MIIGCPKCKAKNRLPTNGDADQLGRPVCASCRNYLFPENFENETNSSSTAEFGTVYIHKHVKGQNVKVGETKNSNSEDRRIDYANKHKTEGFEPHKDYPVFLHARQDIEKRAHKILRSQGYGMSFGTAREIFACTPEIAEAAVEKAFAESEVNRIELEKQRLQQIKKDKLAKAKAKYDGQLEVFAEGLLREWEASQWVKSKRLSLLKPSRCCKATRMSPMRSTNIISFPRLLWTLTGVWLGSSPLMTRWKCCNNMPRKTSVDWPGLATKVFQIKCLQQLGCGFHGWR